MERPIEEGTRGRIRRIAGEPSSPFHKDTGSARYHVMDRLGDIECREDDPSASRLGRKLTSAKLVEFWNGQISSSVRALPSTELAFYLIAAKVEKALGLKAEEDDDHPLLHSSIQIQDLNDDDVELLDSLQVEIDVYPQETIAEIPELNLWASASTDSEALLKIKKEIVTLWRELMDEDESKLGKLPRMWKRILNKKICARVKA